MFRLSTSFFLCFVCLFAYADDANTTTKIPSSIEASYRVKASFLALPLKAKIIIRQLEKDIYSADIVLKSPFFKVDQKERARIRECRVELLSLESKGKRIGADNWDETVKVIWPEQEVIYTYDEKQQKRYSAQHAPTGFTSFFAHQYTSLFETRKNKRLTYTQSKKGWETSYRYEGIDQSVENHFFKHDVSAERFVTPRPDMEDSDMPTVWYMPRELASIPLKMSMKLGVFRLEVSLKDLNASEEEVQAFFKQWGCR